MTNSIVKEAHLAFQDARSDKVYHMTLEGNNGLYKVMVKFGPRLGTLTHVDLTKGWTTFSTALGAFEKRMTEKLANGYKPINDEREKLIRKLRGDFYLPQLSQIQAEYLADFILGYVEERV